MTYEVLKKQHIMGENRPFRACHASTLVLLPDGGVAAAWFAGTKEGDPDVDIWGSCLMNGHWSEPVRLASEDGIPHWNPVLFRDNETLYLFYKKGLTIPKWYTMVIQSGDYGRTWSAPRPVVEGDIGGRGPVRNKPICLHNGNWLAPASIEDELWDAFVDISSDRGLHWEKSGFVPINRHTPRLKGELQDVLPITESSFRGKGIIQPTLWESAPNKVHMLLRSTEGHIYRSDSDDGGLTWCTAYATGLPNNNSGIDLTQLDNGNLVLAYNPVKGNWAARTPLVIRISKDNGETWENEWVLECEPGEYSYPAVVSDGNDVFVTYTWKRENIAYWHIRVHS